MAAYVRFRQLTAQYALNLQAPKADFDKIQTEWLKTLEKYIADYPAAPDTAEAMLQLGIAREFAGQEDDAKRWYGQAARNLPNRRRRKRPRERSPGSIPSAKRSAVRQGGRRRRGRSGKMSRQGGADPVLGHLVRPLQGRHGRAQGTLMPSTTRISPSWASVSTPTRRTSTRTSPRTICRGRRSSRKGAWTVARPTCWASLRCRR